MIRNIEIKYESYKDITIASVDPSTQDIYLYVNTGSDVFSKDGREKYEIEPVRIMLHELQHKMSAIIPINPQEVINFAFGKSNDTEKGKFNNATIERVGIELCITDLNLVKTRMEIYYKFSKKEDEKYSLSATEMTSRIDGLRYKNKIKPSDKNALKPDMFKDTFSGTKKDPDTDWILVIWARNGFPKFQEFLDGLDDIAKNKSNNRSTLS